MGKTKLSIAAMFACALFLGVFFPVFKKAAALPPVDYFSDLISTSRPSLPADHRIRFRIGSAVPPRGKIVLSFAPGAFNIPSGFNYTDIDLATSTAEEGPYGDRNIGTSLSSSMDRVVVAAGTSGSITITLNTARGLNALSFVQIELGENAQTATSGDMQISNAGSAGSYSVFADIYDDADELIMQGQTMIAMVEPVGVDAGVAKIRSNGVPSGTLVAGTTETIISLNSNYAAFCRHSTTPGTSYFAMTTDFALTGANYHRGTISGLQDGRNYYYYVRCLDAFGVADDTDYVIHFMTENSSGGSGGTGGGEGGGSGTGSGGNEGGGTSGGTGTGSGSGSGADGAGGGGGMGGGSGGGTGTSVGPDSSDEGFPYPLPGKPTVSVDGLAYPQSKVYILKDGVLAKEMNSDSQARFVWDFPDLNKGVYTFSVWSQDSAGRKSITQNSTFWIKDETKTTFKVFLPPTIAGNSSQVDYGKDIAFTGQSAPGSTVELWVYPSSLGAVLQEEAKIKSVLSNEAGEWSIIFPTSQLPAAGSYKAKTRSIHPTAGVSDFGSVFVVGVGAEPETELDTCGRSDLNRDKKVNLVDFSILLFNWDTTNAVADINLDGKVNLIDFSLMLFCWTG
jgi:hypothetical protein